MYAKACLYVYVCGRFMRLSFLDLCRLVVGVEGIFGTMRVPLSFSSRKHLSSGTLSVPMIYYTILLRPSASGQTSFFEAGWIMFFEPLSYQVLQKEKYSKKSHDFMEEWAFCYGALN